MTEWWHHSAELSGLAVLSVLGACAAYLDIRFRLLPNLLCFAVLLAGLAIGYWIGGPVWVGWSLLHGVAALVVAMALFRFDVIGGGDGKLYASVAAWFPLTLGPMLAVGISLSGLVLVLAWFLGGKRLAATIKGQDRVAFAKLPYGVAIVVGAVLTYAVAVI